MTFPVSGMEFVIANLALSILSIGWFAAIYFVFEFTRNLSKEIK